jgi:hypothetical protein
MAIYLTQQSDHPYLWLVPADAKVEEKGGVTFLRCQRTTIAIWPINLTSPREDRELTETVQFKTAKGKGDTKERQPRWVNSRVLKASRVGAGVYGFAIEIDEGRPDEFVQQASRLKPETDEVAVRGAAALTAVSGRRVRLQWGNTLEAIKIWRDGKLRDWNSPQEIVAYRTLGDQPLIDQPWQGDGTLTVTAGGKTFRCTVTKTGSVTFEE